MAPLTPILQMFGQSPIRPLQTHMEKAYACVALLAPFLQAVLDEQWQAAKTLQQQIAALEREADDLKKDLRLHLPKSLFLPVPRTDLLQMLTLQDNLANKAKDIAGLIFARHIQFPAAITVAFRLLLQRCLDAVQQAQHAIGELDELLESGFRGNEVRIVENMIVALDRIEHETDEMQAEIYQTLFQLEKTLPPVEAMFLYRIIEWTGDLADDAHSVGGQLYLLLAR
jgi:predicted phosphate transport protein (TIGR00153 family)